MDEIEERRARLLVTVGRLRTLLKPHESGNRLAVMLVPIENEIVDGDVRGLVRLKRSLAGGMGSPSDVILDGNPHGSLPAEEQSAVNEEFSSLTSAAWDDASALLRIVERGRSEPSSREWR